MLVDIETRQLDLSRCSSDMEQLIDQRLAGEALPVSPVAECRYSPFDWRIEGFTAKWQQARSGRDAFLYSAPFYSHTEGYRLCLKLYPNGDEASGGRHLSLFFCLVRGAWDDALPWPMNHNVTLRLVDQRSGASYVREEYDYYSSAPHEKAVFLRPSDTMNSGLGATDFVELDALFGNPGLLRHDCLVVRCTVDT